MGTLKEVKFKLLRDNAKLPTWAYDEAAGADVYVCIDKPVVIEPHQTVSIPLGFAAEFKPGYAAMLYARGGTAVKRSIAPANKVGCIDSDFRGEWHFPAHNHGDVPQIVEPGERIGQIVFHKVEHPQFTIVNELSDTRRGEGMYNSSGTK